jgi:drug/metabolite transporter (DMT)-like permease
MERGRRAPDPKARLENCYRAAIVATSAIVPFVWQPMDLAGWLLMVAIGGFACIGHFAIIKAYQNAPAAVVAPFNYAILIWSVIFGFFVFGDLPDLWTVLGAAVIAGSGLYILHRERLAKGR